MTNHTEYQRIGIANDLDGGVIGSPRRRQRRRQRIRGLSWVASAIILGLIALAIAMALTGQAKADQASIDRWGEIANSPRSEDDTDHTRSNDDTSLGIVDCWHMKDGTIRCIEY